MVDFSRDELAFAILDESHSAACEALSDFVLGAVKANHPGDWKKKICDGLTFRTRPHIERLLQFGQPLTDIYTVCKIIRRHVNDIADYCGLHWSPMEKERLCLHTHGVATARNWAFHGELVSVREVCSSTTLLMLILTTLQREGTFLQKLSRLLHYAFKLASASSANHEYASQYALSVNTVGRTLLYRGLLSFENQFRDLLEKPAPCGMPGGGIQQVDDHDHFISMVTRIKREISEPKKKGLPVKDAGRLNMLKKEEKCSVVSNLGNILAVRNKLAHNSHLRVTEIEEALHNINTVLSVCGIACEKTKLAVKMVSHIQDLGNKEIMYCALQPPNELLQSSLSFSREQRQRVLHPKGSQQHFVGRRKEVRSIKTALTTDLGCKPRMVVIHGSAGIGKSNLAANAVCSLRETHPIQGWLCCSSKHELQQDLLTYNNLFVSGLSSGGMVSSSANCCDSGTNKQKHPELACLGTSTAKPTVPDNVLVVLDDVRSVTVHLIARQIMSSGISVIVTTRSTAVKEYLQCMLVSITCVQLQPFSATESQQLIRKKTPKLTDCHLASAKTAASTVLGNLPLCVNIYSSLLAYSLKNYTGQNKHAALGVDSVSVLACWREIEEAFGDCFHVRGLMGVLQLAEEYLENHPLAVFLLTKLCLTDSETIIWEVVRKRSSFVPEVLVQFSETFNIWGMCALCGGLLGVLDYLFSENGQHCLEVCREDLEELGVISCNSEAGTVHIHRLILHNIQDLLTRKCLYLSGLLHAARESAEACFVKAACENICHLLRAELLLQVLCRSEDLLAGKENKGMCDKRKEEERYSICMFLVNVMESNFCRNILEKALEPQQFGQLLSRLSFNVWKCKARNAVLVNYGEPFFLSKIYKDFPVQGSPVMGLKSGFCFEQGGRLLQNGFLNEALLSFEDALAFAKSESGQNSYFVGYIHLSIAFTLRKQQGPHARDKYLMEAARTCPRLVSEPKKDDIWRLLVHLQGHGNCACLNTFLPDQLLFWFELIQLKIAKRTKDGSQIDEATCECANLLIAVYEEGKQSVLQKIKDAKSSITHLEKMKQARNILGFVHDTLPQSKLYALLNQHGMSLRVLANAYNAVKSVLADFGHCLIKDEDRHMTWRVLVNLVDVLCSLARRPTLCLYSLAVYVSKNFLDRWADVLSLLDLPHSVNHIKESPSDHDSWNTASVGNGQQLRNMLNFLVAEGFSFLYGRKNLHCALGKFFTYLKLQTSLKSHIPELTIDTSDHDQERTVLRQLFCIGVLLEKEDSSQVMQQLKTLAESDATPPTSKKALQRTTTKLGALLVNSQLHSMHKHFVNGRDAFEKGNLTLACRKLFAFWKDLVSLLSSPPSQLTARELKNLRDILLSMHLQVANYLGKIYTAAKKDETTEWFLKYRIQLANKQKCIFASAVCSIDYVEFLQERERWSEALEECHLVQCRLTAYFGDDYWKWLPNALNVSLLHQTMETQLACTGAPKINISTNNE